MAADLSSTSKSDYDFFSHRFHNTRCICRVLEAQSKDINFVLTSASSILHCCKIPTLYTSTIAREVKIRPLIMSSVLESNLAKKVSLRIKIRVDTEGHCSPSLTTVLE